MMAIINSQTDLRNPRIRIRGFGFHFPGEPVAIASLPLTADEAKRLRRLGQETTYIASEDSTALMIRASRDALERNGVAASDLRMLISAPSLMTSYGLEIPAVAIRAALGSTNAQCLNIAQGCVGVLRGMDLAAQMLAAKPDGGDIMVVTSCRASSHTRNMNHGAFFWGDAAAAVILTASPGPGLEIVRYAEVSNIENWGAMRIAFGDAIDRLDQNRDEACMIQVEFDTAEGQIDYIRGEQRNFAVVVDELLSSQGLEQGDIEALFLPSTGKNRVPILLNDHRDLLKRMKTDLRYAHFGGVDPIFSLHQHLDREAPLAGTWQIVASPAFAAQWGSLLLRVLG
jgi:3-oxoacyl-[acyl-carrier-protein] synthase III